MLARDSGRPLGVTLESDNALSDNGAASNGYGV